MLTLETADIFGLGDGDGGVTPAQRAAIQKYLRRRRITDDDEFHAFVENMGLRPYDAEPVAYQMAHDLAKQMKQMGLGQEAPTQPKRTPTMLYGGIAMFFLWATGMGLVIAAAQRAAREPRSHERSHVD